jgi:phosphonate transport system substrate-binding protein
MSSITRLFIAALLISQCIPAAYASEKALSFGVVSQRSAVLSARYWNPILKYVSEKSGVALELKLAKTGPEHAEAVLRGEYDFIYSNHNFRKESEVAYKVFARPIEQAIRGQLIALETSPVRDTADLEDQEVVFPSNVAFVGYAVPMDMLVKRGVKVKPVFAGNQEGAIGQLVSGRVVAAGVNSQVAQEYASRRDVRFRILWSSEEYLNIPISAHPSIAPEKVARVRDALIKMRADPEGAKILIESAELVRQTPPYGFLLASDAEFDNQRHLYRTSSLK